MLCLLFPSAIEFYNFIEVKKTGKYFEESVCCQRFFKFEIFFDKIFNKPETSIYLDR